MTHATMEQIAHDRETLYGRRRAAEAKAAERVTSDELSRIEEHAHPPPKTAPRRKRGKKAS